ncbi:HAD family hydrolase [Novipirellula artificiosorum]|uniref:6-phosphogluconate phosphatase n=1 Tax=Novipirellula artificiosorum TaxID=2528016 RepID=A0A5C6DXG9_9BACT|nr:HAD-IA family hydrolase [Novipirellula artificiosorum]TWU41095.1 6-phosphogluconate phosphatase [Novipirellula artificiosorum]
MITSEFDVVIFDCDGTLVDSEPITTRVLVEYAGEFGFEMQFADALAMFAGVDMPAIRAYIESQIGANLPEGFTEEFRRRQEIELRRQLQPIAGARQLLEVMQLPFCLASNAPHKKIRINLEVTNLASFFPLERCFSAYDIDTWKPDPALFLYAAEKMGVDASRCIVVEDSEAGVRAGIAAGMQVVGYIPKGSPSWSNEVNVVIDSLTDLIPMLAAYEPG